MELDNVYIEPKNNIIKPDVIVSWPRNCDYPLWRNFIKLNRSRFNKVIVVFTETHSGEDYREFVKYAMNFDDVLFLQSANPQGNEDWRDKAIHTALNHVTSDWIWFTEQDFEITQPKVFWDEIYKQSLIFDLIGISQQGRLHPACIFITRSALAKTRQDFGIDPGKGDHFCKFQEDIENKITNYTLLSDETKWGYKHYNGLSHNWHLSSSGLEPNYQIEEFVDWLTKCLSLPMEIAQDTRFLRVANRIIKKHSPTPEKITAKN